MSNYNEQELREQRRREHEAFLNRNRTVLHEAAERIKQANETCNAALERFRSPMITFYEEAKRKNRKNV